MRKLIIGSSIIGSIIIFCLTIHLLDAILLFVLFGILPNSFQLPASVMLAAYEGIVLLTIGTLFRKPIYSLGHTIVRRLRPTASLKAKPRRSAA